jgi:DNA-binding transcriptional MerR regulator
MREGLRIGEVAVKSGFSRKALKVYKRRGILSPPRRTPAGYRLYPNEVLPILAFVAESRRLGLTLSEIRRIVAFRCASPGPGLRVRGLQVRRPLPGRQGPR